MGTKALVRVATRARRSTERIMLRWGRVGVLVESRTCWGGKKKRERSKGVEQGCVVGMYGIG